MMGAVRRSSADSSNDRIVAAPVVNVRCSTITNNTNRRYQLYRSQSFFLRLYHMLMITFWDPKGDPRPKNLRFRLHDQHPVKKRSMNLVVNFVRAFLASYTRMFAKSRLARKLVWILKILITAFAVLALGPLVIAETFAVNGHCFLVCIFSAAVIATVLLLAGFETKFNIFVALFVGLFCTIKWLVHME